MTSVSLLTPRYHAQAASNLAEYIRHAKEDLTVLGENLDWNAWRWPNVGSFVKQNAIASRRLKNAPATSWLDVAFIEFAKAYIRERNAHNPRESRSWHQHRLTALRLLEMALLEIHASATPANIDLSVFNRAAALAREYYSAEYSCQIGQRLQSIAALLSHRQLIPAAVGSWISPIPWVKDLGDAVGSTGEAHRASKLPDQEALQALAEIFNRNLNPLDPTHQREIYTTSVTALLLSAPSRGGSEIHHLPVNLVFKATDRFGKEQVGLRWEAAKGFGSYIKWIWDDMVPVAEIAIDRLQRMSEGARNLARWMEEPKTAHRFYRHSNCPNVDETEPLTREQICLALGLSPTNPHKSLRQLGLETAHYTYSLKDLWNQHVIPMNLKRHPSFPYLNAKEAAKGKKGGIKFSEALFCMLAHQLHPVLGTSPVRLWMPSLTIYSQHVGVSTATRIGIFDRHGYRSSDGGPLTLRSHSLRHLLNTEAQRGKMTNEQIAWWSGRSNLAQNQVYNHMSEQERVDRANELLADENGHLRVVPLRPQNPSKPIASDESASPNSNGSLIHGHWCIDVAKPASCSDLDIQPKLAGINTLYGRCEHDYVLSPCEGFAHCLDCSEHSCIKGTGTDEQDKLARIKELMSRVAQEVDQAKNKMEGGDWGAEDWYNAQCKWYAKLQQLVDILQSDQVQDGAVITLAGSNSQTHMHRVLRSVAMRALEDNTSPADVIQEMLTMLKKDDEGVHPITIHRRGVVQHPPQLNGSQQEQPHGS